jgi:DNA (cytosine-5)-methyltransferase 1
MNKNNGVAHVRDWNIVEEDVCLVDFTTYHGKVDLLCGGPPCQPFSQGGKREGRADARDMFPESVGAVREVQPKAFIIENVRGLMNRGLNNYLLYVLHQLRFPLVEKKHGEKWTEHRARLERLYTGGRYKGLNYKVIVQALKATDYGVPQRRERVFVVGIQADLGVEYSFPLASHTREALLMEQWITGEYWERHKIASRWRPPMPEVVKVALPGIKDLPAARLRRPWRTVRDVVADLPRIAVGETAAEFPDHFLNPGAKEYHGHDGSSLDMPAKTIKAGYHGVPGGENMLRLDDGAVRYFSVRECARLQTFPDAWVFHGAWTRCMKQVGNAVPVRMAKAVAAPLAKML